MSWKPAIRDPKLAPTRAPYFPPNGRNYQPGDYNIVTLREPYERALLPEVLWRPDLYPAWKAPKLWLGWLMSQEQLIKIMLDHPTLSKEVGVCLDGEPDDSAVWDLPDLIMEMFQIDEWYRRCLDVVEVLDGKGNRKLLFAIGCNRKGLLEEDHYHMVGELLGQKNKDGSWKQEAKWYLDPYHWRWKRLPRSQWYTIPPELMSIAVLDPEEDIDTRGSASAVNTDSKTSLAQAVV